MRNEQVFTSWGDIYVIRNELLGGERGEAMRLMQRNHKTWTWPLNCDVGKLPIK